MKRWVATTALVLSPTVGAAPAFTNVPFTPVVRESAMPEPSAQPHEQFVSMVKVKVREATPELQARAMRLVRDQFAGTLSTFPSLRQVPYEISSRGDEVVFSMVTNHDILQVMQEAFPVYFRRINGQADAFAQARIYRAAFDGPKSDERAFLDVAFDDTRTKIRSIVARQVPLRALLEELQPIEGGFSYLIPGECSGRLVDWRFGGPTQPNVAPKEVSALMRELATFFGLRYDGSHGAHIFSGTCKETAQMAANTIEQTLPEAPLPNNWFVAPSPAGSGQRIPISVDGIRPVRAARPAMFFRLRAFE